ncbi:MAG TPA: 2-C-methyl-D-erythritol 4-phosphate cytidylyltransferase [Acholeplasmataceae bacterium]|nr:2-C-methyl-D-erythritol 4-phosphate cytidylyltransferase [Acholeplasmataceae bacterium]
MFDVVLLMAGRGTRTGLDYNKVLYKINNKPIFRYSLDTFLEIEECNRIVLVINPEEEAEIKSLISDVNLKKIKIVSGGNMRQDSVYNGIIECNSEVALIHDAARPLITKGIILNVYRKTLVYSAAVTAIKTIDTIKELRDGKLITLDREKLYNIQTPQGVNLDKFKNAHLKAKDEKFYSTDDVSLLEKYYNISPTIVEGSIYNFKVTTSFDLEIMKKLLEE